MVRKKGVGKKGASTVMLLRAFDLILAAGIILVMLNFWKDVKDDTFIEKSYVARDVAMLLGAAYASPGDLTYCYYEVAGLNFNYALKDGQITVDDSKGKVNYRYLTPSKGLGLTLTALYDKTKPIVALEITKSTGALNIVERRKGETGPCASP